MSDGLPISLIYNLNRLGQSGDKVTFSADDAQRAALARHVEVLEVPKFTARILLRKTAPNRFAAAFELAAEVVQACVVTLEPLVARVQRDFERELHFTPNLRRTEPDVTVALDDDEAAEEIDSLHFDLAAPLLEEFVLAIDPYPRAPGVEFQPLPGADDKPENPFAALKTLKSGRESDN
jgi:uncharacterized metal-binding protein YceD (DUF177 family)